MKINEDKYTSLNEQIYYVYFIQLRRELLRSKMPLTPSLYRSTNDIQDYLKETYANLLHSNAKAL